MLKQKGIGAGAGGSQSMHNKEPLLDAPTRIAVIRVQKVNYMAKDLQSGKVVEVIGAYLKSADKREKLTAGDGEFIYKHPNMMRFYLLCKLEPGVADRVMIDYNRSR